MKRILVSLFVIFFVCMAPAFAGEISFSTMEKDYYFQVGETAEIPVNVENTYDHDISGMLGYTFTKKEQQQGISSSSTNQQFQSFVIRKGNYNVTLGGAASDSPATIILGLTFDYTEKTPKRVALDGITIHFVKEQSQQKSPNNPQKSSTSAGQQAHQSSSQNPERNPSSQQHLQQALQNNQMAQDSGALKKQVIHHEQQKQKLERKLTNDPILKEMEENLKKQGYTKETGSVNPESDSSGTFSREYKKPDGETASVAGEMKNGSLSYAEQTSRALSDVPDILKQNETYQKYNEQLKAEKYTFEQTRINRTAQQTDVQVEYRNSQNKTASVNAAIANDTIKDIWMEKEANDNNIAMWLIVAIILIALAICGYYLYKKYYTNPVEDDCEIIAEPPEPFDHRAAAAALLIEAQECYDEEKYTCAYGKAGQALRTFLSHEHGNKTEQTPEELLIMLQGYDRDMEVVRDILDCCTFVEFAKREPEPEEFNRIIVDITDIIQ